MGPSSTRHIIISFFYLALFIQLDGIGILCTFYVTLYTWYFEKGYCQQWDNYNVKKLFNRNVTNRPHTHHHNDFVYMNMNKIGPILTVNGKYTVHKDIHNKFMSSSIYICFCCRFFCFVLFVQATVARWSIEYKSSWEIVCR